MLLKFSKRGLAELIEISLLNVNLIELISSHL